MERWGDVMRVRIAALSAVGTVGILALVVATPTRAETSILARAGSWEAFSGTTTSGYRVCGISQETDGRYFSLKRFGGQAHFSLQLGTKEWTSVVVDGRTMPASLRFDAYAPWNGAGIGMHFSDGAGGLQVNFDASSMDDFVTQFRNGSRLVVEFRNPAMADWTVSLAGTSALAAAFLGCARKLG